MLRGFPVKLEGTSEVAAPVAFDIDGDGRLEVVVGTRNKLHALEADGNPVSGFPLAMQKGSGILTPVSVGHLGNGKLPAILFGSEDRKLVVLDGTGRDVKGFPVKLPAVLAGAPTLGDVDGDGVDDIAFGTKDGKMHVHLASGQPLAGFPATAGAAVSTAVTVGYFKPGGSAVLFFGDESGNLHAWSGPGKEVSGFPYKAEFTVSAQPVLGDIDNDGRNEVVFGSKDYKVYAVREDGSPMAGFPVSTGYRIYSTCALADMDGDGAIDIIATSGDGKVYAYAGNGRSLPGFPVKAGNRVRASPVVGDLDYDGRPEIAVGSDRNRLCVYRHNGKMYPGYPRPMEERVDVAPLMADLNGDGLTEVVGLSRNGTLVAFKMIKKGDQARPLAWPAEGRDGARRGRTYPNPARYTDLQILPESPTTAQPIELAYRFFDMDGDTEPKTKIRWYRNGKQVPGFDDARVVPASATRKNERWNFTLRAEQQGPVFKSPAVRIVNTAPGRPRIAILPEPGRTRDDLELKIVEESADADGDRIRYNITWLSNRKQIKGLRGSRVPAKLTAAGQRWTAVVVPSDGEVSGAPARVSMTVANSPPLAAKILLKPAKPKATQDLATVITSPARDPDGDKVTYQYHWVVAGKPLNLPRDCSVMPAGLASKHSKIRLEVTSFDGKERGQKSEAQAEIVNSLPSAPGIRIVPADPRTGDDLGIEITKPSADPDQDRVSYQINWRREGTPYKGAHANALRLPSSETKKGQKWWAVVTPVDDEGRGKPARASVVIGNTPPRPPLMVAVNPRPPTTEDLVLKVDKQAVDPDGDAVSLTVIWQLGKQEVARGPDLFRLPAAKTRKNAAYRARIIPSDGKDPGKEVSVWFEVVNTPPSGCKLRVQPKQPGTGDTLVARIVEAPADPDGDKVQMRYSWYRNGEPVPGNRDAPERVKGGQVYRGQRWTVLATPFDGQAAGKACQAAVTVVNRTPSAPSVALEPTRPTIGEALNCKVTKASKDPDGDPVRLSYAWKVDGSPFPTGVATAGIPAGDLRKGQRWQVSVTATDGELSSKAVSASATVGNSPPGKPRIAIRPLSPLSSDDLNCRLTGQTPEPDGDRLTYEFEWFRVKGKKDKPEGKPVHRHKLLPAGKTRKGETWICRVRANDGTASGPEATARIRVENAPPTSPRVKIEPVSPAAGQTLKCVIAGPSKDPDGDLVAYRFMWTKDGVLQSFAPGTDRVPARLTRTDDIWQCLVIATDGKLESRQVETEEVVVRRPD